MTKRYALRMETDDGSIEDAYHHMSRKADAIREAKRAAKDTSCTDVVRIWVDDIRSEMGIASFKTKYCK